MQWGRPAPPRPPPVLLRPTPEVLAAVEHEHLVLGRMMLTLPAVGVKEAVVCRVPPLPPVQVIQPHPVEAGLRRRLHQPVLTRLRLADLNNLLRVDIINLLNAQVLGDVLLLRAVVLLRLLYGLEVHVVVGG